MVTLKKPLSLMQKPFNINRALLQPSTRICAFLILAVICDHCIFLNYKDFVSYR
jgi:hypothetical protein